MNDQIKNFGARPSKPDPRDFTPEHLTKRFEAAPTPFASRSPLTAPVYMQGEQPACGGHGGTTFWQALAQNGETLSPRFVYALCKKIDGDSTPGTDGRSVMQVLQKYGVCTDALFPNDVTLSDADYADWTKIPPLAFVDALSRRIGPYAQLTKMDFQTIKDNIFQNSVVLIAGQLGKEWWTGVNGVSSWESADILPLRPPAVVVSGHFWVDFAFDQNLTYLRNSWSTAWGDDGNGEYGNNYTPYIFEAWVAQLPLPPAPSLPTNPTVPQIQSWLVRLLVWLRLIKI